MSSLPSLPMSIVKHHIHHIKRNLTNNEIEDICKCIINSEGNVPKDVSKINHANIIDKLVNQLKNVKIYDHCILELKEKIKTIYNQSLMNYGENVGCYAATSISEPLTQSVLNTFHSSGISSVQQVTGLSLFKSILDLTKNPKLPVMQVCLKSDYQKDKSVKSTREAARQLLEHRILKDFVNDHEICQISEHHNYSEEYTDLLKSNKIQNISDFCCEQESFWYEYHCMFCNTNYQQCNWKIRIHLNKLNLLIYKINVQRIAEIIEEEFYDCFCVCSPDAVGIIDVFVLTKNRLTNIETILSKFKKTTKRNTNTLKFQNLIVNDENSNMFFVRDIVLTKLFDITITGINGISKTFFRKENEFWHVDVQGSNLRETSNLSEVDYTLTLSNNVWEIYTIYGIEATRQFLREQLQSAISTYLHPAHITLLVAAMTFTGKPCPVTRYGIERSFTGCIAKASFEQSLDNFLIAGQQGEVDRLDNISAEVILGKLISTGTGYFDLLIDHMYKSNETTESRQELEDFCAFG